MNPHTALEINPHSKYYQWCAGQPDAPDPFAPDTRARYMQTQKPNARRMPRGLPSSITPTWVANYARRLRVTTPARAQARRLIRRGQPRAALQLLIQHGDASPYHYERYQEND